MALSRIKVWAAEVLTYSSLNSEFDNLLNNALSLISPLTGNLAAGAFKITGLGAGTDRTDAASLATIQDGTGIYVATVGGTADAITLTPSPAITAYAAGQAFYWIASGANTTAATLTVSGIAGGAKNFTKNGSTALVAGDIPSGALIGARYDGTRFQLISLGAATVPAGAALLSTYTTAGDIVQATGSGAVARLGIGGAGGILQVNSGATALAYLALGSAGGILQVNSGATALAYLALGTKRQIPIVNTGATALAYQDQITLAAEQASTSGTSIDFTGMPSGVRRITIMGRGVSTNGTSPIMIQLIDAGGPENTGYTGGILEVVAAGAAGTNNSTGFLIHTAAEAAATYDFTVVLNLESPASFRWLATVNNNKAATEPRNAFGGGAKALSAELTGVRITMANGTDAFDLGGISASYE